MNMIKLFKDQNKIIKKKIGSPKQRALIKIIKIIIIFKFNKLN